MSTGCLFNSPSFPYAMGDFHSPSGFVIEPPPLSIMIAGEEINEPHINIDRVVIILWQPNAIYLLFIFHFSRLRIHFFVKPINTVTKKANCQPRELLEKIHTTLLDNWSELIIPVPYHLFHIASLIILAKGRVKEYKKEEWFRWKITNSCIERSLSIT